MEWEGDEKDSDSDSGEVEERENMTTQDGLVDEMQRWTITEASSPAHDDPRGRDPS